MKQDTDILEQQIQCCRCGYIGLAVRKARPDSQHGPYLATDLGRVVWTSDATITHGCPHECNTMARQA